MAYTNEKQTEKTTILVTHDIDEAIYLSDRILILNGHPASIQKEICITETNRTREWLYAQSELRTNIHEMLKGIIMYSDAHFHLSEKMKKDS